MWLVVLNDGRHFTVGDGEYTLGWVADELMENGIDENEVLSVTRLVVG